LGTVAAWVARGLTAYDAAYVALAEARDVVLISDDDQILEVAASISSPLASVR
jgi:predicted nucleic acid-binding protein